MRTTLSSHSEVAHYWANQVQGEGKASNLFFEGKSIFSYGRHFEVARFASPDIVFFNSESYSVSTSKHQSIVRRAIPAGVEVFEIDGFDNDHKYNIQQYIDRIKKLREKAVKARKNKEFHLEQCRFNIERMERYIEIFKCISKLPRSMRGLVESFVTAKDDILSPETVQAIKEQQERERKEKERTLKDKIKEWRDGRIHSLYGLSNAILRLKDDFIQTSQGASVSLKAARVLWKRIKSGDSIKGIRLDDRYTVIGLDDNTLRIGCHKIKTSEVKRLARELSW